MEGDGDPGQLLQPLAVWDGLMLPPHRRPNFWHEQQRRCRVVQRLLQEQQKDDQVQLLRSLNNNEEAFVRFCNMTKRNVDLYWIDYQGQAFSFGTLPAGEYVDMDTFVTHPWIFVDELTSNRYVVKQKDVFFPEASRKSQRVGRTLVFIQVPICTLQELALRVIVKRLKDPGQVWALEIPRVLQCELYLELKMALFQPFNPHHGPDPIIVQEVNSILQKVG